MKIANVTEKTLKATIQLIDKYTTPVKKAIAVAKEFERRTRNVKATIVVKDLATKVLRKVTIETKLFKKVSSNLRAIINANDKASRVIKKVMSLAKSFTKGTWKATLFIKDKATKLIKKVMSLAKSFAKSTWRAVVSVKDNASNVLNKLKSTMGMLAAGVTIGVAVKSTVGSAMELESQKASIQFWNSKNGASKQEGDNYIKALDNISANSIFDTNDIYSTGARALGVTGNAKEAERYVKLAQNMAMAIPGKTMSDAVEALADAKNGEWERLKEFNFKGSADTDPEVLFKQMEERFGGASEANKGTAQRGYQVAMKNLKNNLANLGNQLLPVVTPLLEKMGNALNNAAPHFVKLGQNIAKAYDKLELFYLQIRESGELASLIDFFKNIFNTAFDMIKIAIENARPFIESVFNFIIANAPFITKVIETVGAIWEAVWTTVGPLLKGAWDFISPILQLFVDSLSGLLGFIKDIAKWWTDMVKNINNNPIVATVKKVGNFFSGGDDKEGRNAFGSGRIARNGEMHELHKGEKVLTKVQADQYEKKSNGDINIYMNGLTVREEADINKVAKALVRELKLQKVVGV